MPVRRFWLMNGNIHRIMAEGDMRTLRVSSYAFAGGETAESLRKSLVLDLGEVIEHDETLANREGWAALKRIAEGEWAQN